MQLKNKLQVFLKSPQLEDFLLDSFFLSGSIKTKGEVGSIFLFRLFLLEIDKPEYSFLPDHVISFNIKNKSKAGGCYGQHHAIHIAHD